MSDSVRPHRQQPTRLPHPWDSPGKSTEVGCHRLLRDITYMWSLKKHNKLVNVTTKKLRTNHWEERRGEEGQDRVGDEEAQTITIK